MEKDEQILLTVPLLLPDQSALETFIQRVHSPGDSLYGKYLTTEQFADRFGASQSDYENVASYLQAQGLTIRQLHKNRLFIGVHGSASEIENAFQIELHKYQADDGRIVYAPTTEPQVSKEIAAKIGGIAGLNSFNVYRPSAHPQREMNFAPKANFTGNGPNGGLNASDIRVAYSLNGLPNGSGQSIALVEFDGYTASDISGYASQNGITLPTIRNILVDNFSGTPTPISSTASGAAEVTLDIEMVMAVAPAATVLVYEGPSANTTEANWVDVFAKIANDNLAKQVSCSWGIPEVNNFSFISSSENTILMQMSAQGQTFYAASGDRGAFDGDSGNKLSVEDPASQPYATGVGGTTLKINGDGTYLSESSWSENDQATNNKPQGGGGGQSILWPIPSWQSPVILNTSQTLASTTKRNVPDVSLNSNPNGVGYVLYISGKYGSVWGGTSAATPIWAAFTAAVNQSRVSSGLSTLGFINPAIYLVAQSSLYKQCFNDIADSSTNLIYPALSGYDLSTGWGSLNGVNLFHALTNSVLPPAPPSNLQFTVLNGSSI